MGNIYGAEESRLNLRKESKRKLVYIRVVFSLVYVVVFLCLSKKLIEGRNEENSTARQVLNDIARKDVRDNLTFERIDTEKGSVNLWAHEWPWLGQMPRLPKERSFPSASTRRSLPASPPPLQPC